MTSKEKEINYYGHFLQPNSSSLYFIYKSEFELKFDGIKAQKYNLKTAKQLKMLLDEQGFKTSADLIIWTIVNWNKISKELNIKSYPTPSIIYGFRHSLLLLKSNSKNHDNYIIEDKDNEVVKRSSKNAVFLNR